MDKDIKRIIELAESAGSITQYQRELILNKAKNVGDDIDEVEMILETIPIIEDKPKQNTKTNKCPHCGAIYSGFIFQCPECGYVFSQESQTSENNRNYLAELHSQIQKIELRPPKNKGEREYDGTLRNNKDQEIIVLIQAFSVPNAKEALIQGLLGCFSAYEASRGVSATAKLEGAINVKQAWLGKAKEFYYLLQSYSDIDSQTSEILKKYDILFLKADKKYVIESRRGFIMNLALIIFALAFFIGMFIAIAITEA